MALEAAETSAFKDAANRPDAVKAVNAAIKAHIRHTKAGGSDLDDDAMDTRSIYHSARTASADQTAAADDPEDQGKEVTGVATAASVMTTPQIQQVMSLLHSIQCQDNQSAQSSLIAILSENRQATPVVQQHPTPASLNASATSHGDVKPNYKASCNTGGISNNPARLDDSVQPRTPSIRDPPVLTEKPKAPPKMTALVPRVNTSALSATQLSTEEWLRYKSTVPRVFKFLNHCPEEGISAEFRGTSFCQPITFMADTGSEIMLVTQEFCGNMGLGVGPTKMVIQTSVSGLGGLIGQLTDPFDLVLASGTEFELRIPVGPRTKIGLVGVSQNNPMYQVLLCQAFHHISGGYVPPVMGQFVYHPRLWSNQDSSTWATLEGVQVSGPPGTRIAHTSVAVEKIRKLSLPRY